MGRIIGIRHRVKKTAKSEARPTQICVRNGSDVTLYKLEDETAELDFLCHRFPSKMRAVQPNDDLSKFLDHQIVWREVKKGEEPTQPENLRRIRTVRVESKIVRKQFEAVKVPAEFDGYQQGDVVAMALGGSGDRFAFALSRRGEEIGGKVFRINGKMLKEKREAVQGDKEDDAKFLAELYVNKPHLFYQVVRRDRDLIDVRELLFDRVSTMKARIGAEQRLRTRSIGMIFCNPEGKYPEGNLEDMYDEHRANNQGIQKLVDEEDECKKKLAVALEQIPVYTRILSQITGIGPLTAAPIIVAVVDIRRFPGEPQFKAFCGLHVLRDGTFPRARRKFKEKEDEDERMPSTEEELAEEVHKEMKKAKEEGREPQWNRMARQAFWLIGSEQFNRRQNTPWGQKLLDYKTKFRGVHPEKMCKRCEKPFDAACAKAKHASMYSNGHIHKMAVWRTLTKFGEWLYREWTRLALHECGQAQKTA